MQTVYATLADGSNRVTVVLRNNTRDWLEIKKGIPITQMVAANEIPKVTNLLSAEKPKEQPSLTKAETGLAPGKIRLDWSRGMAQGSSGESPQPVKGIP